MTRTVVFAREQLRAPFTLALLVAIPALFVVVGGRRAQRLRRARSAARSPATRRSRSSAGWAAAFISGALGFFQAASSRGADRRLALAGLGPARVAGSRIAASVALAVVAAAAALRRARAPRRRRPPAARRGRRSWRFALLYLGDRRLRRLARQGAAGGLAAGRVRLPARRVRRARHDRRLAPPWAVSQKAADILIAAGMGAGLAGRRLGRGSRVVTGGALVAALPGLRRVREEPGMNARVATATRLGFREQARRPLLLVLLVVAAVLLHHARDRRDRADPATDRPARRRRRPDDDEGRSTARRWSRSPSPSSPRSAARSSCAPRRAADRRLVVAGFRPIEAVLPRLAVLAAATGVVLAVSLGGHRAELHARRRGRRSSPATCSSA